MKNILLIFHDKSIGSDNNSTKKKKYSDVITVKRFTNSPKHEIDLFAATVCDFDSNSRYD